MPKLIVVDANIWISSFYFGGYVGRVLERVQSEYSLVCSQQLIPEVMSVLTRKFAYPPERPAEAEQRMRQDIFLVEPTEILSVCRDPKDDYLLALAVEAKASFLLTGDKDLLVLNPYRGVTILTSQQILSQS